MVAAPPRLPHHHPPPRQPLDDRRLGPADAPLQEQLLVNRALRVPVEAVVERLVQVIQAKVRRAPVVGPVEERAVLPTCCNFGCHAIRHRGFPEGLTVHLSAKPPAEREAGDLRVLHERISTEDAEDTESTEREKR
jgi:hypothetical protein